MTMNNPYKNTRIEFHILQSFPVTCLNRDDVGAPKTAVIGGVTRARVSSQCWKRQVRLALPEFGIKLGVRTKHICKLIEDACMKRGASDEQAKSCGLAIENVFIKKKANSNGENDDSSGNDTLIFISISEADSIASALKGHEFDASKVFKGKNEKTSAAELMKLLGKDAKHVDVLDIALFGRMVAKAADMNVEAAASFSHAISTHKVSNEVEFFTALDDRPEQAGSAHMGSLEFNSATYYRYISLDLGQLALTLGAEDQLADAELLQKAVEGFTKALFVAIPSARQTTQSGASPWEFAKVLVRNGQRLQVPFETAVRAQAGGYLQPSIEALKSYLQKKETMTGSLFGKLGSYEWGEQDDYSIDDLIVDLQRHTQPGQS
tara:strand:- start:2252 stop:3385 length:1134 start_codon:yes stop_codon:yes gene_type:complete